MDNNASLIKRHANKVVEYYKLRARRRFKTIEELQLYLDDTNPTDGLEYSHAEKCTILREQIQLRKKLDGIGKIGDTVLHNCSDKVKYPVETVLGSLMALFKIICDREAAMGTPPPKKPELLEGRKSKGGDDALATGLLKKQHEQAAALTNAFYR